MICFLKCDHIIFFIFLQVKRDIGQPSKLQNISEKVERKREKKAVYQQKGKARKRQQNPEVKKKVQCIWDA